MRGARWARRDRVVYPLLAGVLLSLTVVSLGSVLETRVAAAEADRGRLLARAYQEARFQVGQQESLERKYRLEPSEHIRRLHEEAAIALATAVTRASEIGGEAEADAARDILARNEVYLRAAERLFAATDRGDDVLADTIDHAEVGPRSQTLQQTVYTLAREQDEAAAASGRALHRAENVALLAVSGGFAVGLALVTLVLRARRSHDVSVREQGRASEQQARRDALTGLPNRLAFAEELERRLREQRPGASLGIVLLDLDRFKEINDTLGHLYGDKLLEQIGPRIRGVLRPSDMVARLGGDEFVLLLGDGADPGASEASYGDLAQRVLVALTQPFLVDGLTLVVEASAGLALHPQDGQTPELLLQRADIAMYVAKARHEQVVRYDEMLDEHSPRKLALLAALRGAVVNHELVLHYQPVVDVRTGDVTGVEALARWQHPVEGLLAPDQFIPLAEGSGFIHELTAEVLDEALGQSRRWRDAGLDLSVAVNVSTRCLLDANLPDTVRDSLQATGVPAPSLVLEITESAIVADPVRAADVIRRLHALGVRLSIDDFGTGYTSMRYLRDLPVHELKIDRSFVVRMMTDPGDYAIVQTSIDLGRRLGLRTVAEGIETERTWRAVQALECSAAQGYLFARPLPAAELQEWVSGWRAGVGRRGAAAEPTSRSDR